MKIVIIGHGGHSKVITDIILSDGGFEIIGYLDDKYKAVKIENVFYGPVCYANLLAKYFGEIKFVIAIGNNLVRKKIVDELNFPDQSYISLVHHSAIISPTSQLGIGTVVMPNAVINADSQIGNHCIINS
jgi:acetyltransferase EpsM